MSTYSLLRQLESVHSIHHANRASSVGGLTLLRYFKSRRSRGSRREPSDGGKAFLASMLSAKMSGVHVAIYGLGTCNIYGGVVEDVFYGIVLQS